MNVILIGILGLREIFGNSKGVAIVTQPLRWNIALPNPFVFISVCSAIMNEKLNNPIANTAVLTMRGKLKKDDNDEEAELSCLEEEVLEGKYPVLIGKGKDDPN